MSDWLPGAVQSPQPGGVTLDRSLPPRAVWHITWDALTNGQQPQFSAVSNYLKTVEYCPHLMWNPFTGYIEQFYPASVGGRALKYNNQDGAACIQIEVFFTPGCVVGGKQYNTVAETPCVGLDRILAWTDSLGIPRVWPMGAPQWQGNSRDIPTWNGNAGHYGHCHSPGDDHTDPGPMPSLGHVITPQSTPVTEGFLMALTDKQQTDLYNRIIRYIDSPISAVPGKTWAETVLRGGKNVSVKQELADAKTAAQLGLNVAPAAAGPAIDVPALASEIAAHLTTNQAHELLVALGNSLPKA
jgi:hypothetical protein